MNTTPRHPIPTAKTPIAYLATSPKPAPPNVSHFDTLPNAANISIKAVAVVSGRGVSTLWRDCKQDPDFPRPIRLSPGCTRFNVGEIRAYLAKKVAASQPRPPVRSKGKGAA